jgi:hypothetical protein
MFMANAFPGVVVDSSKPRVEQSVWNTAVKEGLLDARQAQPHTGRSSSSRRHRGDNFSDNSLPGSGPRTLWYSRDEKPLPEGEFDDDFVHAQITHFIQAYEQTATLPAVRGSFRRAGITSVLPFRLQNVITKELTKRWQL